LHMPRFPNRKGTRIIVACMALDNFIRESRIGDRDFQRCDSDANYVLMPNNGIHRGQMTKLLLKMPT
jgi:hypothetical protein